MVMGLLLAMIAGALVSLQNIFNSNVNQRTGAWSATTLVLGMGFVASFTISLIVEGRATFALQNMQPWYWISGLIGVGVVICLMQSMRMLTPTYAISIVMASQIGFALLFDSLGWLGLEKVPFTFNQLLGVLVIIGGIFVFKLGGSRQAKLNTKPAGESL
ncbi:DMT family transporter [Paenibacillus donghaensis]|uniref:EamA-like transporter family protein n=1 Tax=Paenibacillus donghaensis TaxID=414771 RepID=A0A2Z2KKZ2_9BACL|nr:DMT family transporter [Paenibacillus donghaensis]ASA21692.1 hypothetical protein B9T62_13490 [Paenibacillus donghaensis]